ncbi:putative disease resistance protein RGA1 [Spatholobus suberectus]|nr:putative disease resistance protein RGA1 [Spatholobus suberectus]
MGGLEELAKLNKLSGNLEILYLDRRLTLRWDDFEVDEEKGKGHLALLDRLKPHSDLGVLILVGYQGPSLSTWLTSSSIEFKCLVKLRLLKCPGCKYLSQQDQLPKLKILELVRLDNLEYVAQNCDKEAVFYTTLKELTITDCPNLKSWWQTEEDVNDRPFFASISKLHVQRCPLLTCMPLYPRLHMILEGSSRFGKEMVLEGPAA